MQHALHPLTVSPTVALEPRPAFRILILYDTFGSGLRAKAELEPLVGRLKGEFELETVLWEFDELRHQALREQATREVSESDLLVVSAEPSAALLPEVEAWLAGLLPQQAETMAGLLALSEPSDSSAEEPPLIASLRGIAARCGVEFFCNSRAAAPKSV